jgi:hypothetical protein
VSFYREFLSENFAKKYSHNAGHLYFQNFPEEALERPPASDRKNPTTPTPHRIMTLAAGQQIC